MLAGRGRLEWTDGVAQQLQQRAAHALVDPAGQLDQEGQRVAALLAEQLPVGRPRRRQVQTHLDRERFIPNVVEGHSEGFLKGILL